MSDKKKYIYNIILALIGGAGIGIFSAFVTLGEYKEKINTHDSKIEKCESKQDYIVKNMITKNDLESFKRDLMLFYNETHK